MSDEITPDSFLQELLTQHSPDLQDLASPARPYLYKNEDGDQLEIYWGTDSHVGVWFPGTPFTLMYSLETGELIGVTISNMKKHGKRVGP